MAPEIKKLDGDNNERALIDGCKADIYSLGITILTLAFPSAKKSNNLVKFLE